MLETLKNAFRIKDIRKKLFFTFCMMVVIRMGCQLPVPGVNRNYFSQWFAQNSNDAFNFFSAFTGGSFEKMSIFALEYYAIYYILHHYPAPYHCHPGTGGDA